MSSIRLTETAFIPRPVEEVRSYLIDFSTIEQWDPGVLRSEKRTPGPVSIGTQFRLSLNLRGGTPMEYEVSAVSEQHIVLQGHGKDFSAVDEIKFITKDGGTQVDYCATLDLSRMAAWQLQLFTPYFKHMGRKAVQGLAYALTDPKIPVQPTIKDKIADRLILPGAKNFTKSGYFSMPHKGLNQRMDGKTVAITGPTSGLGFASACELSRLGASLVLLGRGEERLQQTAQKVRDFSGNDASPIDCITVDLSLMDAVRSATHKLCERHPKIDVLINNAGALFNDRELTEEGVERSLAIHLYAPALLTTLATPNLHAADNARVINVVSGGLYLQGLKLSDMSFAMEPYDGSKAYARAKRAMLSLNQFWAKQDPRVQYHAMHPGWAATPGVAEALPAFNQKMRKQLRDSRMGADTIVWLASSKQLGPQHSGQFWLDRRPHVTAILPKTEVTPSQQTRLVEHLREKGLIAMA